jgi:AAA domain
LASLHMPPQSGDVNTDEEERAENERRKQAYLNAAPEELDASFKTAVDKSDPKYYGWDVITAEREAAEQELARRQRNERKQGLSDEHHAQQRRDLVESFVKRYQQYCLIVDAGGDDARTAAADMLARKAANDDAREAIDDAKREQAEAQAQAQAWAEAQAEAEANPDVGYAALKARDERRAKKVQEEEAPDPCRIVAEPFVLRPTADIPPREWLYGRHLIRKFLSTTFAPGAGGKTSLILAEAISMVTGRDLLKVGKMLTTGLRVWVWNGEDPKIEIERRLAAICKHYNITAEQLAGRLYVNSGRDTDLKIATQDRNGTRIAEPDVEQIIRQMKARQIDVLIIDPAVSFHSVSENDNGAIDAFAKEWAYIADQTNAAVELAHHVRKGAQGTNEYFVEDGRGAGALLSAARDARVLNFMRPEQALSFGIDGADVFNYFRVDGGKPNMAARSEGRSRWYKIESIGLDNGTKQQDADEVGVVTSFTPTAAADAVPNADLLEIIKRLDDGRYAENAQAADWAGKVVADVMRLDPVRDKMKIGALIKTWIKRDELKIVSEHCTRNGRERPFVKGGIVVQLESKLPPSAPSAPDCDPVTGEVFEPEAAPAAAGEITADMRRQLNAHGFTDEQIDSMEPATARQIL